VFTLDGTTVSAAAGNMAIESGLGSVMMGMSTVTATTGGVSILADEDVQLGSVTANNAGGLSVEVMADDSVAFNAGAVITSALGGVTITSDVDDTTGGTITMGVGNAINAGTGAVILITGSGAAATEDDITVASITTTDPSANAVMITATGNITFVNGGGITTTTGGVTLLADSNGSGDGGITMPDAVPITTTTGLINLQSSGNIIIGDLNTQSIDAMAVQLTSTAGGIIDGGDTFVDINAPNGTLVVSAVTGFGVGNALEVNLGSINIVNTGDGNINVNEVDSINVVRLNPNLVSAVTLNAGGAINGTAGGFTDITGSFVQLAGASVGSTTPLEVSSTGLLNARANGGSLNLNHFGNLNIDQIAAAGGDVNLTVTGALGGLFEDLVPDLLGQNVTVTAFGPVSTPIDVQAFKKFTLEANGDVFINYLGFLPTESINSNGGNIVTAIKGAANVGENVPPQIVSTDGLLGSTTAAVSDTGAENLPVNLLQVSATSSTYVPATDLPSLPSVAGRTPQSFVDVLGQSYSSFVAESFGQSLVDPFQFSAIEYVSFLRSRSRSGTDATAENARLALSGLQELGWNLRLLNLNRPARLQSLQPYTPLGMTAEQLDQSIELLMSQAGAELILQASLQEE
jgi:hypothetical protein